MFVSSTGSRAPGAARLLRRLARLILRLLRALVIGSASFGPPRPEPESPPPQTSAQVEERSSEL